ncbi:MAG: PEGA domain-containing protein [Spirosomaceae bacterium]|nr:PEGA domain-containing protein [Spirosomataceae bacterium]
MKKKLNYLILGVAVFSMSSCATIFTGTKDTIRFNSVPEGAQVYKDGLELCKTPCTVPVKRSINDVDIEMKKDGYQTRFFTLDKEFNVVSVINLLSPIGWGVDALSGSLMKYDRKAYEIELEPKK